MAESSVSPAPTLNELLSNEDFIDLEQITRRPNIFEALNITEYEVRHSTFLSYLLDPNETHGFGAGFLENFLLRASIYIQSDGKQESIVIQELDLDMAKVTSEWSTKKCPELANKRLDILIEVPKKINHSQKLAIGIECKINAVEGNDQLENYKKMLEAEKYQELIKLFLTKSGLEGMNWYSVQFHGLVTEALDITIKKYGSSVSEKIKGFLEDYRQILIESDESSERSVVVKKIADRYKETVIKHKEYLTIKHRHAYEAVMEEITAQQSTKLIFDEFEKIIKVWGKQPISDNTLFRFYPKTEKEAYPANSNSCGLMPNGKKWAGGEFPILFEIKLTKEKIKSDIKQQREEAGEEDAKVDARLFPALLLVLGPLKDIPINKRAELVNSIRGALSEEEKKEWGYVKKDITDVWTTVLRLKNQKESITKLNADTLLREMTNKAHKLVGTINKVIQESAICEKNIKKNQHV